MKGFATGRFYLTLMIGQDGSSLIGQRITARNTSHYSVIRHSYTVIQKNYSISLLEIQSLN
jgi:hypothetical protein